MTQAKPATDVRVSIIIPAYNEAPVIGDFLAQLQEAMAGLVDCAMEILVINDGSTDTTAQIVKEAAARDPRLRLLSFGRNLGHQRALIAGIEHARGAAVVMMDADGQHPPQKARELVEDWLQHPSRHVIQAVRGGSQGGAGKDWSSALFYWCMRKLCPEFSIMAGMSDFRLLDREAVALLSRYPDRHRNLRLLVASLPMPVHFVEYGVAPRLGGASKYTFSKMLHLAADGLFAYSNFPLRLSLYLSCVTAAASLGFFAYAVAVRWRGETAWGWASIVCLISGLFSGVFGILAIVSEYVARIYEDVRARPLYWVDPSNSCGLDSGHDGAEEGK